MSSNNEPKTHAQNRRMGDPKSEANRWSEGDIVLCVEVCDTWPRSNYL